MKITELSPENRPRERLQNEGPQALSSSELLAIILKSGTKKENVLDISNHLLAKFGLDNLSNCSLQELQKEHGIGRAKACQIIALFELYKRVGQTQKEKDSITCAKDVADIYLPKLKHLKKENFVVVYLDTKNKIIVDETISIGTLNSSVIHPREIFHGAVRNLANTIIVLHNHPSGDPGPSTEDLRITKRLEQAGKMMSIPLLDHIIIGRNRWWSWKEGEISPKV